MLRGYNLVFHFSCRLCYLLFNNVLKAYEKSYLIRLNLDLVACKYFSLSWNLSILVGSFKSCDYFHLIEMLKFQRRVKRSGPYSETTLVGPD